MSSRGYEAVIGIEIHVQLSTKTKIFSSESTAFEAGDNENTSPVSVGMPGTLPVLNSKVVEYSIKTGLALGCDIRRKSVFARKNYFYPDLPKGYQISQYDQPICENGSITFKVDGKEKTVSITRAHMEEDAGKSNHHGEYTLINYNRSGIPLLEVVSGPDMRTPQEAAEYARTIRQIVRYLDVCDGNLEEGSLRCDCNVSVRKEGAKQFGTKVEIKNINSFRFVEKAIEYEIERQIDCVERGDKIIQETRLWDPDKNRTFSMRAKEDAQDYRYFPDPDLQPVIVTDSMIEKYKKELPELPIARAQRFQDDHALPELDATVLTTEKDLADFYEDTAKESKNFKASSNWIMTELLRELNSANKNIKDSPIKPAQLGKMIAMIDKGTISGKIAKTIFQEMWASGNDPEVIMKEKGLVQISDPAAIEKLVDEVLAANAQTVEDHKSGKKKNLFGFFVGAVMKASKGQANPDLVNKILLEKLK
ncbi:Asp-tRNA(Asn)/Glu-tRNA(Gln) amidotransferase subunit GatB [Bdellovibrio bacteriovorus]|uniref:Aspartyl/glutamyl-tRNA(Asn/Gln) amidotransferase subunit B n=1 Tax=Bdellovibrio bacteriovorus (strain ATCC 15356 / DSM 50701 / NCIMB 9529 / HD100) TaxID=264462 RepID=GATB_BDEBA|nr:Asp-tRNA(Asn)/Glu-tRNA(Gln) amidotransferase subunit GatB [Bdellovibrio bacteriovorus]P61341.1 RecName: Full=Aspartyl/glutamyl-tRNA(Asn/Gln) amidotransferase subunit B; Short=Asp/Glu-ADT subunit B [Bdellovibrio bacteriovorus HD100]AHZ85717.1 glutamyl-tRNA amidotransferase [Bdellovibrio bacteriovorus]BEV66636.1 Aspartyl/glutamyl-tRNA(Asn/Gln) amidotransferase subunit B [Bdellovibrio bacteriovorus]CAE77741.1 glutamyl-tRNA(Gln) amidotransferase, B subunit [Bdellovibrio bacteriovorus HD100]